MWLLASASRPSQPLVDATVGLSPLCIKEAHNWTKANGFLER